MVMSTFYGPTTDPNEIWHWKYVRKYRKNGKWNYVYPGDQTDSLNQPQSSDQDFTVTIDGEETNLRQKGEEYVNSNRSKKVYNDVDQVTTSQTESYKNLAKDVMKEMRYNNANVYK